MVHDHADRASVLCHTRLPLCVAENVREGAERAHALFEPLRNGLGAPVGADRACPLTPRSNAWRFDVAFYFI